jgi:hypothetical protein
MDYLFAFNRKIYVIFLAVLLKTTGNKLNGIGQWL